VVFFLAAVLIVPLLLLRVGLERLAREEDRVRQREIRESLFGEMERFQDDLWVGAVISRALTAFERTFSEAGVNPTSALAPEKAFLISQPERFMPAIKRHFQRQGLPQPILVVGGGGNGFQDHAVYADSRFFSGMSKPSRKAASDLLQNIWMNAGEENPTMSPSELKRFHKTLQNHLKTLFGKYRPSQLIPQSVQEFIVTGFRNRRVFCFSNAFSSPTGGDPSRGFAFFAVFFSGDFTAEKILRKAVGEKSPAGIKRRLLFLEKRAQTRFFARENGLAMLKMMPFHLQRQFPTLVARGRIPHLLLWHPGGTGEFSLAPAVPWLNGVLGLGILGALGLLFGLIDVSRVRVSLRLKFSVVIAPVIAVPLTAFVFSSAANQAFQAKVEAAGIRDRMSHRLEMFEQGFSTFERDLQNRLFEVSRQLAAFSSDDPRFMKTLRSISEWGMIRWVMAVTKDGVVKRLNLEPPSPGGERRRKFEDEIQAGTAHSIKNFLNQALEEPERIRTLLEYSDTGKARVVKSSFNTASLNFGDYRAISALDGTLLRTSLPMQGDSFMAYSIIPSSPEASIQKNPSGIFMVALSLENMAQRFVESARRQGRVLEDETSRYRIRYLLLPFSPVTRILHSGSLMNDQVPPWLRENAKKILAIGAEGGIPQAESRLFATRVFTFLPCLALGFAELKPFAASDGWRVFLVALIAYSLAIFLLVSRLLTEMLINPFSSVIAAFQEIKTGNYQVRLDTELNDEFRVLGDSLNRLSRGLLERQRMERFVSERVIALSRSEGASGRGSAGEKIEGSILVADIRGFTTISETNSPEAVVSMLNEYFTEMETAILLHGGIIDKFVGDAIVAVFFPVPDGVDCAIRACRAGLEMRRTLADLNAARAARGEFTVDNGVAVATGEFVSGSVRSGTKRSELGIYGETVTHAEEMEPLTKMAVRSRVICCAHSAQRSGEAFFLELLPVSTGEVRQKGDEVFEVLRGRE
jgi:class 3 adenylate cyclase